MRCDLLHCAVGVVQFVDAALVEGDDVIHLVGQWVEPVRLIRDCFTAPVAGWFAFGDDASVPVSSGGVAFDCYLSRRFLCGGGGGGSAFTGGVNLPPRLGS